MIARRALLPALLAALAAGCAVGPDYERPETRTDPAFAGLADAGATAGPTIAAWWRAFRDPILDELMARAAQANIDLEVAEARVREARALRTAAALELLPIATAGAGYVRGLRSEAATNEAPRELREFDLYSAGFDATWELDIFGRVRRNIEANDATIAAAEEARRNLLVTVLAEVARNYMELRGMQNRLAVARRNAENQRETVDIARSRVQGGMGTDFDLARAQAQLSSTLAVIPALEAAIGRAIHRLSVLLGEQPTALRERLANPQPLPTLPSLLAIGSPADLLKRRPDIRAADRQLHAATARVGVAKADFFPRVTFHGSVAIEADVLRDLGSPGSEAWAFGPSISWAAFDIGRVDAFYKAAGAQAEAAHARYRQTVLLALEDVESALLTFGRERARRELLREAARANEQAAALARDRYQNGIDDFLVVLDAERRLLESQDLFADGETRTAIALVAVYKALGGGWEVGEREAEPASGN